MKAVKSALAALLVAALAFACAPDDPDARAQVTVPPPPAPPVPLPEKPNIVFILADDASQESLQKAMPKTLSLIGDQGVTFENATYSIPLCCPSRVSIMRGQYPHNTGVWTNAPPMGGWKSFSFRGEQYDTLATDVNAQGYRTIYVGKFLNGYNYAIGRRKCPMPSGWDYWFAVGSPTTEKFCENGHARFSKTFRKRLFDPIVFNRGIAQMNQALDAGSPVMVAFNPYAPHTPPEYPDAYGRAFTAHELTSPSINEQDTSDKPQFIQQTAMISPAVMEKLTILERKRLRSVAFVDDQVARIVGALASRGELDNTYIVFYSDNGYHLGEHRLSGPGGFGEKRTPYIEDVRFPLIVRGPGIEAGSTSEAMVQNVDLRPTFAEMVGADVPSYVDGTSLLGEAKGDKHFPRTYAYSEGLTMHDLPRVSVDGPAVKLPTWKATYSPDGAYHQWATGEEEFYDLDADPYQLDAVRLDRGETSYEGEELRSVLEQFEGCAGETCTIERR